MFQVISSFKTMKINFLELNEIIDFRIPKMTANSEKRDILSWNGPYYQPTLELDNSLFCK